MNIPISLLLLIFLQSADDPMSLVQHAYQLQQSGDYAAAADAYRAFLKLRPDEVGAHSNLGVVLTKLGRYDEAIQEYEAAEKLLPGDARISVNLALAYEKSGRLPQATAKLSALHAATPQDKQITMLLADACLQGGDYARVTELLQPVERENPDDLAVAYLLGTALIRQQRIPEGQVLLDRILKNGDSAEARFLLGMQMVEAGDYPAALKQFAAASEVNAKLPELQAYYGQALLMTGDADGAAAAFSKELEANPNNFSANLGLGQIWTVRKRFSEAEPLLRRALLLRPQSGEAALALGECLSGEGKFADARPLLQAALKAMPNSAQGHRDLAILDARLGMTQEAARERAAAERLERPSGGPRKNALAPDFALRDVATQKLVSLSDFRGKSPVVLIFGSYTCPNFRASAPALKNLQAKYGTAAAFLLIYIREAHAAGDWQSTRNEREGVALAPATLLLEKQEHAVMCSRALHLPFQALVDGVDGKVETAYDAWPSRAFVVSREGRVVYATRLTELDFSAEAMERAIAAALHPLRALHP
jgi:tetratricopeptide (TPR) repeat protein